MIMPGGRPTKYKARFIDEAFELCKEGFTDLKLSKFFKVSKQTLYDWQKEYPEFLDSIRRGKDIFNCLTAENCLLKRIKGGRYSEVTRERVLVQDGDKTVEKKSADGKKRIVPKLIPEIIVTKKVSKTLAPDPKSIIYFLNNRDRDRWKNLKAIEVSGPDGKKLSLETKIEVANELLGEVDGATRGLPNKDR